MSLPQQIFFIKSNYTLKFNKLDSPIFKLVIFHKNFLYMNSLINTLSEQNPKKKCHINWNQDN